MKVNGISVACTQDPQDDRTMEQFVKSEWSTTSLGQLLIALAAETEWSGEYAVYAKLGPGLPFLEIYHPTFLAGQMLIVHEKNCTMSVRGVEDAVRRHFHDSEKSLKPEIERLQEQRHALSRASDRIMENKARATIVAVFPETTLTTLRSIGVQDDLYCFTGADPGIKPVFAARNISNDFVGGVARINRNGGTWYAAEVGVKKGQRLGIFWEALARTFAARELKVPENIFYCAKVESEEKPFLWPRPVGYDPNIVRKIVFLQEFTDSYIVVTFGADNLPEKVEPVANDGSLHCG